MKALDSASCRPLILMIVLVGGLCAEAASPALGASLRIKTRSGTTVEGQLVAETSQGFLISTNGKTQLILFTEVVQLDDLSPPSDPAPTAPHAIREAAPSRLGSMTREQLIREQQRVGDAKPGLGLPITFIVVSPLLGAGLFVGGAAITSGCGPPLCNDTPGKALLGLGVGVLVVGLVVGIVLLVMRLPARTSANKELEVIEDLLESKHARSELTPPQFPLARF